MERLENKTTCSLASFPGSSTWAEIMRAWKRGYLFLYPLQLLYIIVIVNAKQRMKCGKAPGIRPFVPLSSYQEHTMTICSPPSFPPPRH